MGDALKSRRTTKNMDGIRAFIAVKISQEIQDKLAGIQDKLKQADAQVSWVNPANIHLTLKFLGDIQEAQIPAILEAMTSSAKTVSPFSMQIGYAGAFPNMSFPRVIWIGVTDDEQGSLKTLEADLSPRLEKLGFQGEGGRFQPHLTLGRVRSQKNKSSLFRAIEGIVNIWVGVSSVDALYLIRSELKSTGSEYTEIGKVNLGK